MTYTPRIFKRSELLQVPIIENGEPLVDVKGRLSVICRYQKFDMVPFVGEAMPVRESLIRMMSHAQAEVRNNKYLVESFPRKDLNLMIVYAYRHPDVQKRYFDKRCAEFQHKFPDLPLVERMELAHICSADPEVAGHPTGGAVDVTITADGEEVDMGCEIADFSDVELMQPYSNKITSVQMKNRIALRNVMMKSGFAPFDGEYWHFSYGDREWAMWYGQEKAIYKPIHFSCA